MAFFVVDICRNTRNKYDSGNTEMYILYNASDEKFTHFDTRTFKRILSNSPDKVVNAELVVKKEEGYSLELDRNTIRGKTGSFEKLKRIDAVQKTLGTSNHYTSYERPIFYTVINYYDKGDTRYYTVATTQRMTKVLRMEDLAQLIKEGNVINAKLARGKNKYYISGINWTIPMKENKRKIDEKRNNALAFKLTKELERESPDLEWDKICVFSVREVGKYLKSIYTGEVIAREIPSNGKDKGSPAIYNIVPWDVFKKEFVKTGIKNFKKELGIENLALTDNVKKLITRCLWKFSDFEWPMEEIKLNIMLGILDEKDFKA